MASQGIGVAWMKSVVIKKDIGVIQWDTCTGEVDMMCFICWQPNIGEPIYINCLRLKTEQASYQCPICTVTMAGSGERAEELYSNTETLSIRHFQRLDGLDALLSEMQRSQHRTNSVRRRGAGANLEQFEKGSGDHSSEPDWDHSIYD